MVKVYSQSINRNYSKGNHEISWRAPTSHPIRGTFKSSAPASHRVADANGSNHGSVPVPCATASFVIWACFVSGCSMCALSHYVPYSPTGQECGECTVRACVAVLASPSAMVVCLCCWLCWARVAARAVSTVLLVLSNGHTGRVCWLAHFAYLCWSSLAWLFLDEAFERLHGVWPFSCHVNMAQHTVIAITPWFVPPFHRRIQLLCSEHGPDLWMNDHQVSFMHSRWLMVDSETSLYSTFLACSRKHFFSKKNVTWCCRNNWKLPTCWFLLVLAGTCHFGADILVYSIRQSWTHRFESKQFLSPKLVKTVAVSVIFFRR